MTMTELPAYRGPCSHWDGPCEHLFVALAGTEQPRSTKETQ